VLSFTKKVWSSTECASRTIVIRPEGRERNNWTKVSVAIFPMSRTRGRIGATIQPPKGDASNLGTSRNSGGHRLAGEPGRCKSLVEILVQIVMPDTYKVALAAYIPRMTDRSFVQDMSPVSEGGLSSLSFEDLDFRSIQ